MTSRDFLLILGAAIGFIGLAAVSWWLAIGVVVVSLVVGLGLDWVDDWRINRTVREIKRNRDRRAS